MQPDNLLADRLREARTRKGLTQAEVAKSLGVTAQAISNFERGRNNLSQPYLDQLCKLYDIDPATLNEQPIPDLSALTGRIEKLVIESYEYDSDLLPPVLQCLNSLVSTVEIDLRQFRFHSEKLKLSESIEKFSSTFLPPLYRSTEHIADTGDDELVDLEYAINKITDTILRISATHKAPKDIAADALDTFSNQLTDILKNTLQKASAFEVPEDPSPSGKE